MDYRHEGHTLHVMVYHIIWYPKRRRKVLVGPVWDRLEQIIDEVVAENGGRSSAWRSSQTMCACSCVPTHTPCHRISRRSSRGGVPTTCVRSSPICGRCRLSLDAQRLSLDGRQRQPGAYPALHRKALEEMSELK